MRCYINGPLINIACIYRGSRAVLKLKQAIMSSIPTTPPLMISHRTLAHSRPVVVVVAAAVVVVVVVVVMVVVVVLFILVTCIYIVHIYLQTKYT